MKFTTPATASAPYTEEAPPVRTSTRSISAFGIWFRSGAPEFTPGAVSGLPGISRRPLIRTSVRLAFRPRRSTVAVPVEPFEIVEPWAAIACGSWLMMSSTRILPVAAMSSAAIAVTGLMLVMFGVLMREPVTTTSWMVAFSAACAGSATTAAPAALASSACRTARCKERF